MKEFCWKVQNKIDFQHSKYTTILRPATLHKILTSASNISSLFFASDFTYLSDEDIEKITRLTRLQHLKLPNIKNSQIFTNLINHFRHLQSLTLSSHTTENQLITISQLTRLKSLCLAFMKNIPGNTFYHLTTLQRLTRLVLIGFKDLDDSTMKYISTFTNLIYLSMTFQSKFISRLQYVLFFSSIALLKDNFRLNNILFVCLFVVLYLLSKMNLSIIVMIFVIIFSLRLGIW
jgi:hypothetical protein